MAAPSTRNILPLLTISEETVLPAGGAAAAGLAPSVSVLATSGGAVASGNPVGFIEVLSIQGAFARGYPPVVIVPVSATLTVQDVRSADDVFV